MGKKHHVKKDGQSVIIGFVECKHCKQLAEIKRCVFKNKTVLHFRFMVECKTAECYQTSWSLSRENALKQWEAIGE